MESFQVQYAIKNFRMRIFCDLFHIVSALEHAIIARKLMAVKVTIVRRTTGMILRQHTGRTRNYRKWFKYTEFNGLCSEEICNFVFAI